ncbi:MAG TPA: low molecular weight protein-tyrosine-phosphatase [Bacteroidia bacterium]|nr:low molecular weight protein-tyrosine-phosphatase [Bacteroidia bacterium]
MSKRLLFVCLGNICRSPLAEGIMSHLSQKHGLNLFLDSAGTSDYHRGEAPDPRTIKNARKNGIDLSGLRARPFRTEDFDAFDLIFAMDHSNLKYIQTQCKNPDHLKKLHLLPHPELEHGRVEIPDPYYGNDGDFESVFQLVYKSCEKLCAELKIK